MLLDLDVNLGRFFLRIARNIMKNLIKQLTLTLILTVMSLSAVQAVTPRGRLVGATGLARGGSDVTFTWAMPADSPSATYKVYVRVPTNGTATNALYRVYPKGNLTGNTVCSSTGTTYPCFEVSVNQATNQGKWLLLKLGTTVQWKMTNAAYVTVNPLTLPATEMLSVAAVSFDMTPALKIGQTYQGGIIFYLNRTRQHGLIAAAKDQSTGIQWYNGSFVSVGETSWKVGTGKTNTANIVAKQGAGSYAAKLCDDLVLNGYSDWFLPSKDELNLMYENIGQLAAAPLTNAGGFVSSYYWSSSEYDNYVAAWYQYFSNGYQDYYSKNGILYVRAVRVF